MAFGIPSSVFEPLLYSEIGNTSESAYGIQVRVIYIMKYDLQLHSRLEIWTLQTKHDKITKRIKSFFFFFNVLKVRIRDSLLNGQDQTKMKLLASLDRFICKQLKLGLRLYLHAR